MLRLLPPISEPEIAAARTPRPLRASTTRPTDRHEPWPYVPEEVAEIAAATMTRGMDLSVACSVVLERRLLLGLLGPGEDWSSVLDRRAEQARARAELCPASAAYLRSLNSGVPGAATEPLPPMLALPARLSDRLLAVWPPKPHLASPELEPAVAWERAAVLTGLTMTEWGLAEALAAA